MSPSLVRISPQHDLQSKKWPRERITKACQREKCIIGIDEAGRGPVLGPLVYSLFICPESRSNWLKENGANDSKQLTEDSRERFFNILLADDSEMAAGWKAAILHPELISNCMLRRDKINLNELSFDTVFSLIESVLGLGVEITAGFVDTLGKPEKYEAALARKFPNIKFTVRSKADSLFPVVGAASIVAKVLRDDIIVQEGINASGYPSDPNTISWLNGNIDPVFGFPNVVRFSWGTCFTILSEKCHQIEWHADGDDGGEEDDGGVNNVQQKKKSISNNKENQKKRSIINQTHNKLDHKDEAPFGLKPVSITYASCLS